MTGAVVSEGTMQDGGLDVSVGQEAETVKGPMTGAVIGGMGLIDIGKKVEGDEVHGDKISITELFAPIHQKIEEVAADPDDKQEMKETVRKIEEEVAKGEEANPTKVERWLKYLGSISGDVLDVAAASLAGPTSAAAMIIKKVAQKAKEEAAS